MWASSWLRMECKVYITRALVIGASRGLQLNSLCFKDVYVFRGALLHAYCTCYRNQLLNCHLSKTLFT